MPSPRKVFEQAEITGITGITGITNLTGITGFFKNFFMNKRLLFKVFILRHRKLIYECLYFCKIWKNKYDVINFCHNITARHF